MQFQVPQFIEMEDTIFGPLTFRQFLYLTGGVGLCFIFYVYLPIYIAIVLIIIAGGGAVALAFYKYNGRNFIYLLESAFKYAFTKKLYLWKQSKDAIAQKEVIKKQVLTQPEGVGLPRLSESRLKDLAWSLDIQNNEKGPEQEEEPKGFYER